MSVTTLTITRPDDWHLHLRDGEPMRSVVGASARVFGRAVVMPNLEPPVTTVAAAAAYRERIAAALPATSHFAPLLTLYLTDDTPVAEIAEAQRSGFVIGVKYYPAGATTNSASGVTAIERVYQALEAMQSLALPLLVHGEVTADEVDIFDRERMFVDQVLRRSRPGACRRHHYAPAPAPLTQCAVRRRDQTAPVLPPHTETRIASPGAAQSRDQRQ